MRFHVVSLWLLQALLAAAYPGKNGNGKLCYTEYAKTKPPSIRTTTITKSKIIPITVISTQQPVKTITPKPITYTIKKFTITKKTVTLSGKTNTFITTSTVFQTTTVTEFDTISATIVVPTTETRTSTETVSTAAGFTPIRSANPGSAKRDVRAPQVEGRASPEHELIDDANRKRGNDPEPGACVKTCPARFPSAVVCKTTKIVKSTKTVTKTIQNTKTVVLRPSVTKVTSIKTFTVTVYYHPTPVSTQVIVPVTVVVPETTTEVVTDITTSTQTIVVDAPAETFYPACQADNFITTHNGVTIDQTKMDTYGLVDFEAASKEDCCQACMDTEHCAASMFLPTYRTGNRCYNSWDSGVCNANTVAAWYFTNFFGGTGPGLFGPIYASNGWCGQMQYDPDPNS